MPGKTMSFPLGKPILLMALVALLSGAIVATRKPARDKDLVLWVFADAHAQTYRSIIDRFERDTGVSVDIQFLSGRALPVRLETMFMSGTGGRPLPDLVELEIGWVGRFFRAPVREMGLLPLNELLARGGWDQRIVQQRFAPWSKRGTIFGVPHDVHPVTITYRKDLFDEAGLDLESAQTWPEFQDKCLAFQRYWRSRGYARRHALDLPRASADYLITMLLQRGINLIDDEERDGFNDPRVAQTIAFYAQLVAGPRRIAGETAGLGATGLWVNDFVAGDLCATFTPDWKAYNFQAYAPQLAGRLRMMPLPRFDQTDAPTSTWGGTMIGITRNSDRREDAWRLIEFLYFSDTGLKARQRVTKILPPVMDQWNDAGYHRADPYFGGQKVDELYIDLARQIPRRYVTPATTIAGTQLSIILNRAVEHVERHGETGLEGNIRRWCAEASEDLRRRVAHGKFDQ